MNFTSFTEAILKNLQSRLGEEYTVLSQRVRKNNGVELTGIVAKKKNCNTSPTVYINEHYKENITKEEIRIISDRIYEELKNAQLEGRIDISGFLDYEKARCRLAYRLIHAEKNRDLLEKIPHKRFYNLAQVFYYDVQEAPFLGRAAILVNNSHLDRWGVSQEELIRAARENTPRLFPSVIENIEEVMRQVLAETVEDREKAEEMRKQLQEELTGEQIPMYVLSNRQKINGAACMLYPDVLKKFAGQQEKDLYLLPSSIHEVILIPADAGIDREALREIVADINRTQVAQEEVLSDSVYYYSRARDKILWIA